MDAALLELVASVGVLATVGVGGVPEATADLDHDVVAEEEIDPGDRARTGADDDLAPGPGEAIVADEAKEASFEQ